MLRKDERRSALVLSLSTPNSSSYFFSGFRFTHSVNSVMHSLSLVIYWHAMNLLSKDFPLFLFPDTSDDWRLTIAWSAIPSHLLTECTDQAGEWVSRVFWMCQWMNWIPVVARRKREGSRDQGRETIYHRLLMLDEANTETPERCMFLKHGFWCLWYFSPRILIDFTPCVLSVWLCMWNFMMKIPCLLHQMMERDGGSCFTDRMWAGISRSNLSSPAGRLSFHNTYTHRHSL